MSGEPSRTWKRARVVVLLVPLGSRDLLPNRARSSSLSVVAPPGRARWRTRPESATVIKSST